MANLQRHLSVKYPYGRALERFEGYLKSLGWQPGGSAVLHFRVGSSDVGLPQNVELAKDVIARFTPHEDPTHLSKPVAVEWSPSGGGPYPTFKGAITISEDEDYGSCVLTLSGTYEPPGGLVGRGFDALVGHRIAEATAAGLLKEIARWMEAAVG